MSSCSVASCNNRKPKDTSKLRDRERVNNVSFHRFPKPPAIRNIWIARCGRSALDKFNPDNACVCSEHFTKDDYEGVLRAELMGDVPFKRLLKKTAIPSIGVYIDAMKAETVIPDVLLDGENLMLTLGNDYAHKIDEMNTGVLKQELKTMYNKTRMLMLEYENLKIKNTEQDIKIKELQKENSLLKKKLFEEK